MPTMDFKIFVSVYMENIGAVCTKRFTFAGSKSVIPYKTIILSFYVFVECLFSFKFFVVSDGTSNV
jgi:hypothetical protein